MANTSITFIAPLKNCHLSGDVANRKMYSRVNQVMHTASTMASLGLSSWLPSSSSGEMALIVFKVSEMVEAMMKEIEITATTY